MSRAAPVITMSLCPSQQRYEIAREWTYRPRKSKERRRVTRSWPFGLLSLRKKISMTSATPHVGRLMSVSHQIMREKLEPSENLQKHHRLYIMSATTHWGGCSKLTRSSSASRHLPVSVHTRLQFRRKHPCTLDISLSSSWGRHRLQSRRSTAGPCFTFPERR